MSCNAASTTAAKNNHSITSEEKFADVGVCRTTGLPIRLCYQTFGQHDAARGAVLLVMGLASQLLLWDGKFCTCLASHGYYVIRFDNRDIGRSTFVANGKMKVTATMKTVTLKAGEDHDGNDKKNFPQARRTWFDFLRYDRKRGSGSGRPAFRLPLAYTTMLQGGRHPLREVYTLEDMASDSVRLLDALGVMKAHVVGMCMGGMIAQVMSIQHPTRVESLSLISSFSSSSQTVWPSLREVREIVPLVIFIMRKGFASPQSFNLDTSTNVGPSAEEKDELSQRLMGFFMHISAAEGSPYPIDSEACLRQVRRLVHRSSDFSGVARQYMALMNAPSREAELRGINVPTIVIHGTEDPIVPHSNGRQLADTIPCAKLVSLEGVGHVLHPALREQIVAVLVKNMRRGRGSNTTEVMKSAKL